MVDKTNVISSVSEYIRLAKKENDKTFKIKTHDPNREKLAIKNSVEELNYVYKGWDSIKDYYRQSEVKLDSNEIYNNLVKSVQNYNNYANAGAIDVFKLDYFFYEEVSGILMENIQLAFYDYCFEEVERMYAFCSDTMNLLRNICKVFSDNV